MSSPPSIDKGPARHEAARRFLYGRIDYERARTIPYQTRAFKLDRMRELLNRLGNPHEALPAVHIAGTKGKGSAAAMVGAILVAAGHRTGLFTSPHLDRLEERLAVDGQPCPAEELVELIEQVAPAVQAMDEMAAGCDPPDHGPTYFEMITAMAMLHYAARKVDAIVLEVGLGGRLDSTNVCRPLVSVITSISFDHTKQLGNSLESIAWEKAGIVKPGVPVVSGVVEPGPREVIRAICRQHGSRLVELGVDFDFEYAPPRDLQSSPAMGKLDFRDHRPGAGGIRDVALRLVGRHQAANAAIALAAVQELREEGWSVPEEAVRRGLAEVEWPARVEVVARRPAVVVDSAHNLASVDVLVRTLDESFSVRHRVLIFATTYEKDVRVMLSRLLAQFDHVILTRYVSNPRAVPPEELGAMAAEFDGAGHRVCQDPTEAWEQARALAGPEDLICVTGSFFLAAEIRQVIRAGR